MNISLRPEILVKEEQKIIDTLNDKLCGRLREVNRIIWQETFWDGTTLTKRKVGYIALNGHVIGLFLHHCGINEIPEEIGKLKHLKQLDLSFNNLFQLPDSITELSDLFYLNLARNYIKELPTGIGHLRKLKTLNAGSNQINGVPESICLLSELEELYLYANLIPSLPQSFGDLTKLKILNLDSNLIKSLPNSFGNLSNLVELRIWGNQLSKLPESFTKLKNLKYLYLRQNNLEMLPEHFGALTNLISMNLWKNKIKQFPKSFKNLTNLMELDIKGNPIERKPDFIGDLKNLKKLSIDGHLLKLRPRSLDELVIDLVGNFELRSGELTVADPSMGVNKSALFKALNGNWLAFKIYGALVVVNEKYYHRKMIPDDWKMGHVGLNMEYFGVFDSHLLPDENLEENLEALYEQCNAILNKFDCGILFDRAVVSRGQDEHGIYPVYYYPNDKDYVVAIWIDYEGGSNFDRFWIPDKNEHSENE